MGNALGGFLLNLVNLILLLRGLVLGLCDLELEIAEDLLLGSNLFFGLLVLLGGLLFGLLDLFLGLLLAIFILLGGFGSLVGVLLGLLNECLLRLVLLGGTLELGFLGENSLRKGVSQLSRRGLANFGAVLSLGHACAHSHALVAGGLGSVEQLGEFVIDGHLVGQSKSGRSIKSDEKLLSWSGQLLLLLRVTTAKAGAFRLLT